MLELLIALLMNSTGRDEHAQPESWGDVRCVELLREAE